MYSNFPNQRVPYSEKITPEWTRQMANWVVNLALSLNDKVFTKKLLDMSNGIVPYSTYSYVFKKYIKDLDKTGKESINEHTLNDLRDIDLLLPIKEKVMGEFISAYNDFQIFTDDPTSVTDRDGKFKEVVWNYLNQKLVNMLNEQGVETGTPSQELPDPKIEFDKLLKQWDEDRVEKAQHRLDLLLHTIDAKLKYIQIYYYWWACEECYSYRTIKDNDIQFEVVSPLEYYRVPSKSQFAEDDDYGVRVYSKSMYDILDSYSEYLSEKDIQYIKDVVSKRNSISSLDYDSRMMMLKSRDIDLKDYSPNCIDNLKDIGSYNYNDITSIPMAHYIFKTEVKIGYLTYINANGELTETVVDETYEFNINNGDINIVWDWKQELYEGEIIGYRATGTMDAESIYTKVRPIKVQREHFANNNLVKSPYNGMNYIHPSSAKKPMGYRVNPSLALIRIFYYKLEESINNWKDILSIPQSVLTDEELTIEQRLAKMKSDSIFIFDDTNSNINSINGIKEIATQHLSNFIVSLVNLIENLKQEMYTLTNMTPSRLGSQAPYQGKSATETALMQTNISNLFSTEIFNLFRVKDYCATYDWSKVAWIDGKSGSFTDSKTGKQVSIDIDPIEHYNVNIGINIGNSRAYEEKLQALKQVAMSAAQNGDVEVAIEGIMNDNVQVLHKYVTEFYDSKKKFEAQMEQYKQMAQTKITELQSQLDDANRQKDIYINDSTNAIKLKINENDNQTQMAIWDKRLEADTNGNGYIDKTESNLETDYSQMITKEKLDLQRSKLLNDKKNKD